MKVILLKDVPAVGKKYEVKTVADGYALNYLFPNSLAEMGTAVAIKKAELLHIRLEEDKKIQEELLAKNLDALNDVTIELSEKANEKGNLFASIHKNELVSKLREQTRLEILPEYIQLEKPIKQAGEFTIEVKVADKKAAFKLVVTGIEA